MMSTNIAATTKVKCLRFNKFGAPSEVLHLEQIDLGKWDGKCALVRWLASPINPIDLYIIKGKFGATVPAIGGVEGVGIVEKICDSPECDIEVGDRVIKVLNDVRLADGGCWTQYSYIRPELLVKLHPNIDLISAATLAVNSATAFALLQTVVPLHKGDCIIQNAANSGVGRAVIQLAKHFDYQTINVVRQQESAEEMALLDEQLCLFGADWVFTEEKLTKMLNSGKKYNKLPRPKLALDSVGGESTFLVSSALDPDTGTLVLFGGISGTPPRIAPDLRHGPVHFAITEFCSKKKNVQKVNEMFAELQELILAKKLRPPLADFRPMEEYRTAVKNAISHGTKQILLFSEEQEQMD